MSMSRMPPESICAAELMAFDGGSGSLRVRIAAMDQLMDAMSSATAPVPGDWRFSE